MTDRPDRVAAAMLALAGALAVAVAAVAGHPAVFGPWSPWPPLLVSLAVAGAAAGPAWHRRQGLAAGVRAGCWLAAGGWVAYGYQRGLSSHAWTVLDRRIAQWHAVYWEVWACGALVAVVLAAAVAVPAVPDPPSVLLADGTPADPVTAEWSALLARVDQKFAGVHDVILDEWDTGNGYTVRGKLPATGVTWRVLANHADKVAAALDLPTGGGVSVGRGDGSAGFAVDVLLVDAMAEAVPYPGLEAGT